MTKKKCLASIVKVEKLTKNFDSTNQSSQDIYNMWVRVDLAKEAMPGQFVSFYCKNENHLLPRPISICEINREEGLLRFVYRVVGFGTEEFSKLGVNDEIALLGPLGNGFPLKENGTKEQRTMLVGGGIGIPPLLQLAKECSGKVNIVLGYRDNQVFLKEEFEKYGKVFISTEDGSVGIKGNVIDIIKQNNLAADVIYSCGPNPMLRGVKDYGEKNDIETYLSMEEKMACGIGACLACVCKSTEKDHHTQVYNKRVCQEGPVFLSTLVEP